MILDACRDNPFKSLFKSGGVVNGFANQPTPSGILLAYATEENKKALASFGDNSPYVEALKQELPRAGQSVFDMFTNVRKKVDGYTKGYQKPSFYSKLDLFHK